LNILALDTADNVLSVALETEAGISYAEIDAGMRHSELLLETADGLCRSAGISPADIATVACMKGPGSFTGLRIGFSAAKGVALALGIPLAAIPTLDCLACPLSIWPGIVLAAMDAKKSCFFAALYRGGQRLTDYVDAPPQAIAQAAKAARLSPDERIVLTGSGAEPLFSHLADCFPPGRIQVNPGWRKGGAKELLLLAKSAITDNRNDISLGPAYIRKSDAELNADKRWAGKEWQI